MLNKINIKQIKCQMDCWKETVLLSLQQDLSELTAVIWEMIDSVPNANFNSWLFPTKFCRDLLSIQMRNSADYTHHLEHILDRIYYVFNILLIHLQGDANNAKKCISRPLKMTLGKCVLSVWKAIAVLVSKNKSIDKRLQSELEFCHGSSQTDYVNSGNCVSCDVALVCLKTVSDSLERNLSSSRTSRTRESLQANAFRVNLSNCMHSICEAIEDDVSRMSEENSAHYEQLSRISGELSEVKERLASEEIAAMENQEEIRRFKDFLAKEKLEKQSLHSMNEILSRENNKLKEEVNLLQEKTQRLENSSERLEMEKFRGENENDILRKENCDSKRKETILEEELYGLQMKCSILQSENTDLKLRKSESQVQMKSLKKTLDDFDFTLGRLQRKFDEKFEVSLRSMIKQEASLSNIEDKIADSLSMSNRGTDCVENLQRLAGNPLEDMTYQMDLNSKKIKKLIAENHSLSIVINKLKLIKH